MVINYKKIFLSLLVSFFISLSFYYLLSEKIPLSKVLPISYSSPPGSLVIARVGQYTLSELSGWTSPFAEVTLTSWALARKTMADKDGFFIFTNIPIRDNLGELCLVAEDINHLASFPVCLPPPKPQDNLIIRNVLLPPSIFLEKGNILAGKTTKASGMTFPDSEVDVYLFENPSPSFWSQIANSPLRIPLPKLSIVKNSKLKVKSLSLQFKVIKLKNFELNFELCTLNFALINPAYATGLPIYKIKSNSNGFFEFSLPTTRVSKNRLFAVSFFRADIESAPTTETDPRKSVGNPRESSFPSPKSNTLVFAVYKFPWFLLLLLLLLLLFILIFISRKEKKNKLLVLENKITVYQPYCETKIYFPKILKY